MRTLVCIVIVSGLVAAGCGRIGFDNVLDDGGIPVIDGPGASNDAFDSLDRPDASSAACSNEVLLTSITETHSGRFGFEVTYVVVTFRSMSSDGFIGVGAIYVNGYSGIADFRPNNDTGFNSVMMPLLNGTDTSVRIGMYDITTANGSSATVELNDSLVGATITMARQHVVSLSLSPAGGGRTDFSFEATWELYGCPAAR